MKFEEIPYINILNKKYATKIEIMNFLNVSKSTFEKLKLNSYKIGKNILYSINELKLKIGNRIDVFKDCEYINGFPNYIIDKNGNIYLVKGKIIPYCLKSKIDKDGYFEVCLSNNNGRKYFRVHRLVASTYISNPFNLPEVNHKDGHKDNNNVSNLEWCTNRYNIQHAFDNNLNHTGIKNQKSSPVVAYKNNGQIDGIFENISDCGKYYGLSEATVRDSDKNKTTKGRKGYYFRKISKDNFYKMREDKMYEKYFVKYNHTTKCKENTQHIA